MRFSIPKNIGTIDLLLRLCISFVLIYYGFFDNELIQDRFSSALIGIFGSLNLIVALARFCPLYKVVGINTYCQSNSNKD